MGYRRLFGGGRVLGDSLGTLRDGVLGKFTREDESHTVIGKLENGDAK